MSKSFWISVIFISLVFWELSGVLAYSETLPKEARNRFVDELSKKRVAGPFEKKWSKLDLNFDVIIIIDSEKEPPHWGTQKKESPFGKGRDHKTWTDFLVANGYLEEVGRENVNVGPFGGVKGISIKYQPTLKLLPYIGRYDSGLEYLIIAKPQLRSIGKVEKHRYGDYDAYRFAYTFYLESFPELPKLGPYKKVGEIRYNRLTEEYEIYTYFAELDFYDKCEKSLIDNRQKWMPESRSTSTSQDLQSKDAELQKLQAFITDQWKQIIQIPPPKRNWRELVTLKITGKYDDYSSLYLLGVNRRNLAGDALSSANKFLKKGNLEDAKKYADLGARHYIESNELFKASEQVFSGSVSMTAQTLEALYRGPKEASKYGWFLMCGPKCYEVADYVFLMTDFAVDYGLEGMDEAKKNLIVNAFVKTLLMKTTGLSNWIQKRTIYLINPRPYNPMDRTINSPEFQKSFMKVLAESGAYANSKLAETGAKTVIQNSLDFIKGSSNLTPGN